jgi:hypothetical protein
MTIKVLYRNLELVFESVKDVDDFADELEQRHVSKDKPETQQHVKSVQPATNGKVEESSNAASDVPAKSSDILGAIPELLKSLNENTKAVIYALANAPEGLSDAELREKMGVESKLVFAGIMSAIAKSAIKVGIGFENVVTRTITDNRNGKRKYHYILTDDVKKELTANPLQKLF